MSAKKKHDKVYAAAETAARKAVAALDGSITSIGIFILSEYASSVRHGEPNEFQEKLYAGTPLEEHMQRCRENDGVAEFWSR